MCLFGFQGDLHNWDMVGLLTPISFVCYPFLMDVSMTQMSIAGQ